ncbi:MAG: MFS transporter [Phycisphaerales bacterium]
MPPDHQPEPIEERRASGSELVPEVFVDEVAGSDRGLSGEAGGRAAAHDPYAALRIRNYRLFASGFVCSSTGLQMLSAAVAWEVWQRTHDPWFLGLVGLVRAAPVVALALVAGQLIDMLPRKAILIVTQLAFALAALAMAVASWAHAPIWAFFLLIFIAGCARSFNGPTRSSLLPALVPADVFHNAITWNSGVFQFSAIVGPLAAGVLLQWTNASWPVYVCTAVLCGALAFTAGLLEPRASAPSTARFSVDSALAGLNHIRRERVVLAAITLDLLAVLFGGATALLPIYAEQILDVDAVGYGALRAAPFVGALLMALVLAHRPPFKRSGATLLLAVAGYGVSMFVFGISGNFLLSLAALGLGGALDNISVVIRHVLVQARTPDHLRGRVGTVNSVFIECSNELGGFESGSVARVAGRWYGETAGAMISVVSGGIGTLFVVAGVALAWPQLRTLGTLIVRDDPTPPAPPPPPNPAATARTADARGASVDAAQTG